MDDLASAVLSKCEEEYARTVAAYSVVFPCASVPTVHTTQYMRAAEYLADGDWDGEDAGPSHVPFRQYRLRATHPVRTYALELGTTHGRVGDGAPDRVASWTTVVRFRRVDVALACLANLLTQCTPFGGLEEHEQVHLFSDDLFVGTFHMTEHARLLANLLAEAM